MNFKLTSASLLSSLIIMGCSYDQNSQTSTGKVETTVLNERLKVLSHKKQADAVEHQYMASQRLSAKRIQAPTYSLMQAPPSYFSAPNDVMTNHDKFTPINSNSTISVLNEPVSTFSVDVDTGSYSVVRQYLNRGQLPPSDAVRVEEMVNYFDYDYYKPALSNAPFSVSTQYAQTPWNKYTHLVQIGLQGYLPETERSAANLVFLLDVSGSMNSPNKLPLLKNAFKLLSKQLTADDSVSIVVYAGASGVVLKPTQGNERSAILQAINNLRAGGSTNGAAGINLAYQLAEEAFIEGGINRVILATDGDFNVGMVSQNALVDLIKRKKNKGIALTTLGFGHGHYNDALMEQLADHGDGNYAFIDNLSEARKVLVGQISATLETIAKDVKIQVEWNPNQVSYYRLIGYENRLLNREDFNNDAVDAGEIGAGHTVTALYEVTLNKNRDKQADPLRYQKSNTTVDLSHGSELAFVKLRYKRPKQRGRTQSILLKHAINTTMLSTKINQDLQFAASVAAFAQKLRQDEELNYFNYDDILKLAQSSKGEDPHGYRGEFLKLIKLAKSIDS